MKNFLKSKIGNCYKFFFDYHETLTVFLFHEVTDNPSNYQKRDKIFHRKKEFIDIISWIENNYNIINPNNFHNSKKKNALITFDDGFKGIFDFAIPHLIKKKISSISFLNFRPIIKQEPNIVATVQFLRDNNLNFMNFMKENNLGENVHLEITPNLFKSFIFNNKKIDLDQIIIDQGKIVDYETLKNFSDNEYVLFGNHMYEHWNSAKLSDEEFEYYFKKNNSELLNFSNNINFYAFPFGILRKNFSNNFCPERLFVFNNGVNYNYNEKILDRIYIRNVKDVKDIFYYNILRSKIKKKFNL